MELEFDTNFLYFASAASTVTVLFAATWFYYCRASDLSKKPTISTSNSKLRNFLEAHVPALFEKYSPSWLFWEGRLQSIMGLALRIPIYTKLPYKREIFRLSDGGELGLDYLEPPAHILAASKNDQHASPSSSPSPPPTSAPSPTWSPSKKRRKGRKVKRNRTKNTNNNNTNNNSNGKCGGEGAENLVVLLLPGLTSSSQTSYVKSIALAITHAGATVVVLNNRGLGGVPLKTPRTYCASKPDDAREVILHLREKFPERRLLAVGTSLGGILLCQYIINHPEEAKELLVAALVVSICWDPMSGTTNLEKPFVNKYIMNYNLTQNLRNLAAKYRTILEERNCWDFNKVLKSRTLREFDAHFTAPQFGYDSVMDYYRAASVKDNVHKFPIPVFGFNAYDDPLQPGDHLPVDEAQTKGSNLALIVTQRGGHLGFLEATLPRPFHYLERFIIDFVRAVRLHSDDLY